MRHIRTLYLGMTVLSVLLLTAAGAAAADYNIMRYGAVADTTVLSTEAVQKAIDECSENGGGRVVVPTGAYKIGTIVLKSNVNLHLEHGATLYGSTSLADYRPMKSQYVSLRTQTETIQLVYADNVQNVVIDGYGTIDGRGKAFKKLSWNDEGITRPHLLRFISRQWPVAGRANGLCLVPFLTRYISERFPELLLLLQLFLYLFLNFLPRKSIKLTKNR